MTNRIQKSIRLSTGLLLILALSMGLLACGGGAPEPAEPMATQAQTVAAEQTESAETEPTQAPTQAAPALGVGEPAPSGDGICPTREDFFQLLAWIQYMDPTYKERYAAYEVVRDVAGAEAEDGESEEPVFERESGRHTMKWYPPEKDYNLLVTFSGDHEDNWRYLQYSCSGPDLPGESLQAPLLQYDYFDEPVHPMAGPQTLELKAGENTVTLGYTLPDHGWSPEADSDSVKIKFAMDPQNASGAPFIEIRCASTMEDLDFYKDRFEELTDVEGRTFGDLALQGRAYEYMNYDNIEYYGQLESGVWISIRTADVSFHPEGDGMAILNSITIQ